MIFIRGHLGSSGGWKIVEGCPKGKADIGKLYRRCNAIAPNRCVVFEDDEEATRDPREKDEGLGCGDMKGATIE